MSDTSQPAADAGHILKRARTLLNLGMRQDALDALEQFVVVEPGAAAVHQRLGELYLEDRRPEEALEHLEAALSLAPMNVQVAEDLLRVCDELQREPGGPAPAPADVPGDPARADRSRMVRGSIALHCGREAEAEELFLAVPRESPLHGPAQRCLEHLRARLTLCRESARTLDGTTLERAAILEFMRQLFAAAAQQEYLEVHGNRYAETLLRAAPFLSSEYRFLDVGSYCGEIPVMLWKFLNPAEIRSCSLTPGFLAYGEGKLKREGDPGIEFGCRVESCNIERDTWPYPDESVDVVLCLEVLEHLREHPLFMMAEANRVLEDGGLFILTTPNTHSFYHVLQILRQDSPNLLPVYAAGRGGLGHVKEYTFGEIRALFEGSGFELVLQQTFSPYAWAPDNQVPALKEALRPHGLKDAQSGMLHFVVARKTGPPRYEYLRPIYDTTLPR